MSDVVFLDLETTGLDPAEAVIWDIGLITDHGEFQFILELSEDELFRATPMALSIGRYYERSMAARLEFHRQFDHRFAVGFAIDPGSSNAANWWEPMKERHLMRKNDRQMLAAFLAHEIDRAHIVGAVPNFDERFLGDFLREYKYPPSWHYHLVDIEALCAGKLGIQPPWNSKELSRAIGIDPSFFEQHTALGDARWAKAVYEGVYGLPPTWPGATIHPDVPAEEDQPASTTA